MLHYCKKCGRLVQEVYGREKQICDYCNSNLYPVPDEYLGGKSKGFIKQELKQQFIDEYIKSSPEFDQYLFDHWKEDILERRMEEAAFLEHYRAEREGRAKGNRFGIECPYCHATNVRKVSFAGRAVSTGLFGLGSSKIGKQWHCNRCGSDF